MCPIEQWLIFLTNSNCLQIEIAGGLWGNVYNLAESYLIHLNLDSFFLNNGLCTNTSRDILSQWSKLCNLTAGSRRIGLWVWTLRDKTWILEKRIGPHSFRDTFWNKCRRNDSSVCILSEGASDCSIQYISFSRPFWALHLFHFKPLPMS
jgi:hypothetical protein